MASTLDRFFLGDKAMFSSIACVLVGVFFMFFCLMQEIEDRREFRSAGIVTQLLVTTMNVTCFLMSVGMVIVGIMGITR